MVSDDLDAALPTSWGGIQAKFCFAIDCILSYKNPTVKPQSVFGVAPCFRIPRYRNHGLSYGAKAVFREQVAHPEADAAVHWFSYEFQ